MTPQTNLATNAPWPNQDQLAASIAASHERLEAHLALQLKAKKRGVRPYKYQKVKP
jgi:hypothetical protein